MYIWMILAMFVAALYSFNLHVRSDSESLYVEPQAEALVAKLSLQHDAVRDYLNFKKNQMIDNIKRDGYVEEVEIDGEPEYEYLNATDIGIGTNISGYGNYYKLPGAEPAAGAVSKVFCVKNNDMASYTNFTNILGYECEEGEDMNCCYGKGYNNNGDIPQLYVVTYAPIPVRWQARDNSGSPNGRPSKNMIKGLHKFGVSGVKFGYFDCNPGYDGGDDYTCEGEVPSGKVRDIQTNKDLGEQDVSEFSHLLKGYGDSTVVIPNIISTKIKDECDPTCIMAISTVDK